MPASIIAPYIISALGVAAGTFAAAAITFGVRLVTTLVISSIIAKRSESNAGGAGTGTQQIGNRIQLPPATDNKIGVVYGSAYMKPIIVDAKISTDQKTMWHVMAFSEAMDNDSIGTFSFGDIYWGDKKLIFGDGSDLTKVTGWINSDGTTESQPNGYLNFYLYRDGSSQPLNTAQTAIQVLQDAEIAVENRWDSTKLMTKLVFAIVKIKYDQEAGITGLAEVTAVINNSLTLPGSVIKDYLKNSRYGAGVPESLINLTSLTALDTYSQENIEYTPYGGGPSESSDRYTINGPVDTTKNFLENLVDMTESCDSWLSWNESQGKWSVILNRSYTDLDPDGSEIRQIRDSSIIGGVNINPIDLNATYNSVEVQFPNTKTRDQPGYHFIDVSEFPNIIRSPNEPDNKLSLALPYTNNIVQAQYIAARRMLQSREDLVIAFTTDYSGIQIDAGDVIGLHHQQYGWGDYNELEAQPLGKLFRVNQVQEGVNDDGTVFASITASEYNDAVYDDDNIDLQDFEPELNTGIPDPTLISAPSTPTITNSVVTSDIPSFQVNTTVASTGTTVAIEFWYSPTSAIGTDYVLYKTEVAPTGTYTGGATVAIKVTGLAASTWYWRCRAVGTRRKSSFTNAASLNWDPDFISGVVGQNFAVTFQPPYLSVPRTGTSLVPQLPSVTPVAYGAIGGQVIPFTLAVNDQDALFTTSSWRIGSSTSTGYTAEGIYTEVNCDFNTDNITVTGLGAQFPAMSSITGSPATLTVPCRYKDAGGNVFQGPPATIQFAFLDPGAQGQAGFNGLTVSYPKVWFLAPISASTATITNGVWDRGTQSWISRPITQYTTPSSPSSPVTVNNYDYALSVTTGSYRYSALADANISSTSTGTFTAVWSVLPQIEAGFGPTPQFIDFTFAGGTAFYKSTDGIIAPENITVQIVTQGITTPAALWSITGATSSFTSTVFFNDTVTVTPNTNTNVVTLTVSIDALTKTLTLPVVGQGASGDAASRGFIPLSYIPITVNPNTASQAQLDAAWFAYTGLNPQENDGASFYFGTTVKSFSYNGTDWITATRMIDGELIVNGTIRANQLSANEIFTNKLASTNADDFGSNSSAGYWLDGASGNAHFGGNVHIGNNLTVEGLIAAGELSANVVYTNNVVINAITNGQVVFVEKSRTVPLTTTTYVNPDGTTVWPANTRGFAIPGGAATVPEIGPEDGGRIIIQLSTTMYQPTNPERNLIELWRAGSNVTFAQEIRGIAVSTTTDYIQAVGTDGYLQRSVNAGSSWTTNNASWPGVGFSTFIPNDISQPVASGGATYMIAVGDDGIVSEIYTASTSYDTYRLAHRIYNEAGSLIGTNTGATTDYTAIKAREWYSGGVTFREIFIVGTNGAIVYTDPAGISSVGHSAALEYSGTVATLRDIAFNPSQGAGTYKAVAVGDAGTVITSERSPQQWSSSYTPGAYDWNIINIPVTTNLNSVAYDSSSRWVAVGNYGIIITSTDNAATWTEVTSPTNRNLKKVVYAEGRWVAVGLGGMIITSTDGTTWTVVTAVNDRNLYNIVYDPRSGSFFAVGDAQILSSASGTSWSQIYNGGRTQKFEWKRLWYVGSNDTATSTATAPVSQQIGERASVSVIVNDTDYVVSTDPEFKNVYVYYLVVGNLAGNGPVTVTNPFLLTTEFKR